MIGSCTQIAEYDDYGSRWHCRECGWEMGGLEWLLATDWPGRYPEAQTKLEEHRFEKPEREPKFSRRVVSLAPSPKLCGCGEPVATMSSGKPAEICAACQRRALDDAETAMRDAAALSALGTTEVTMVDKNTIRETRGLRRSFVFRVFVAIFAAFCSLIWPSRAGTVLSILWWAAAIKTWHELKSVRPARASIARTTARRRIGAWWRLTMFRLIGRGRGRRAPARPSLGEAEERARLFAVVNTTPYAGVEENGPRPAWERAVPVSLPPVKRKG